MSRDEKYSEAGTYDNGEFQSSEEIIMYFKRLRTDRGKLSFIINHNFQRSVLLCEVM